ncbi:MAG: RNA-binding domain-containing protein [Saprospiraceae bacterium]
MISIPINIDDLVKAKTVETNRLELKNGLNSDATLRQVVATISAFANDFHNLNGGYIILGIEENNGVAQLPPVGIEDNKLDDFQKKIRGQCNRISPEYYPIIEPVAFQGKNIIVIWCPAGEARPYLAPDVRDGKERVYYIRQGPETVEAVGEIRQELLRLTARIPYDDRAAINLDFNVLDPTLIKRFLVDTRSKLVEIDQSHLETCLNLRIVRRMNGHFAPLNVGLLFFTSDPHAYLQGARAELAHFADDASGKLIEERYFSGPIHEQIRSILRTLEASSTILVQKIAYEAEALRSVAFPYAAMEEAIVNAFYHRAYDTSFEPVKIYLYPDRMEIISYPGPVPGIKPEHFLEGNRIPPVQNRNRRVGDFLKQLGLAEMRNTGIPTILREMRQNGSPAPRFDFDEERSYFRVTLPAHPRYVVLHAVREAAYLWTTGQKEAALQRLSDSKNLSESGVIWGQIIDYKAILGDVVGAETEWKELLSKNNSIEKAPAARAMARAYLNNNEREKARAILREIPPLARDAQEVTDSALLFKNLGDHESAHRLFQNNLSLILDDPRPLNEFADVKLKLAKKARRERKTAINNRLLNESAEMYRRVIQLTSDDIRKGWCWFRLAEIYQHLRRPQTDIESAFQQSLALLPNERVIQEQFEIWKHR